MFDDRDLFPVVRWFLGRLAAAKFRESQLDRGPLRARAAANQRTRLRLHCASITSTRASRIPVPSTHIAPMHQRALLLSLTASSAAAFVTPASVAIGTRPAALTRRWADELDDAGADDAAPATEAAAPSLEAMESAVLEDAVATASRAEA